MVDDVVVPPVGAAVEVLAPSVAAVNEVEKELGANVDENDGTDAGCLLTAVDRVTVSYVMAPSGGGIIVSR